MADPNEELEAAHEDEEHAEEHKASAREGAEHTEEEASE